MSELLALLPALSVGSWLLVIAGALVVGFSKTALPGAGTIAVGLFALAMPAKESTAALLLLLIVGDMTALWVYRREPDWRTLLRLLPSAMIGVVLGAFYFAHVDGAGVRLTIGVILLVLVAVTVWRRGAAARRDPSAAPPVKGSRPGAAATAQGVGFGLLGGFTTMVANAAGPVMSMYFYAMRMPVLTFLGTSAWYFAIVNLFKVPFSAGLGLLSRGTLLMDALLIPVVLLGAVLGARVARRIPQKVFENLILGLTVAAAIGLLVI
ncbi:sulfite exporter TauE/SafE family protein [Brachybacterium saurashtrense]|uniref:Probable membrane transporter protein n=1 Tax=Brachybacterium saurashtrense TaxID=556288 RepID=A0A345YS52_9MICO|nr:sulfite exporter TauE/SafE family protein [Brachybacterium saurashtrense]AXK46754.1 sulfite exporter TauE/SafE family protein [Brachybacterium saurashtrense]RRR22469.1 sulfite exporter TauE/SafE family protein [Brachybacterium saurashtrense]